MGDVINLNQARKARDKQAKVRQAAANRVRFGRDKGERRRNADDRNRLDKELDGKALPPESAAPRDKDSEPKA